VLTSHSLIYTNKSLVMNYW